MEDYNHMKRSKPERSKKFATRGLVLNYSRDHNLPSWSNSSAEMENPTPSKKESYLFYTLTFVISNFFSFFTQFMVK